MGGTGNGGAGGMVSNSGNSTVNSTNSQGQGQSQSQTATGGNASGGALYLGEGAVEGGTAYSSSNSHSSSNLSNVGNSSNRNTNTANGGAGGTGIALGGSSSATIARGAIVNSNTIADGAVRNSNNNLTDSRASVGNVSSSTANSNNANNSSRNDSQNAASNSVTVRGDTITYEARRIPVASAYASPLTSGFDTCSGSTTGAVQTGIFGISLGSTHHDKVCETLKLSRELKGQGYGLEACQLMINEDRRVAAAFHSTGRTCAATVPIDQVVQPLQPIQPVQSYPPLPVASHGERG